MKCPFCGNECIEGIVRSKLINSPMPFMTETFWFPKEEDGKWFKDHRKNMPSKTEGWFCENCRKVIGIYDVYPLKKNES